MFISGPFGKLCLLLLAVQVLAVGCADCSLHLYDLLLNKVSTTASLFHNATVASGSI
jgi:hypothetical protein